MKRTWYHIKRGCGTLVYCGVHPGTSITIDVPVAFAIAGVGIGGIVGGILGALLVSLFCVPIYLIGAYDRSKLDEQLTSEKG